MSFWTDKRILITGGAGFIGSHLVERLWELGAHVTSADRDEARSRLRLAHLEGARVLVGDLTESAFAVEATRDQDIVFHMAAKMAGLKYNAAHPADMLVENALLDLQVLKSCARNRIERILFCSGALVYDAARPAPTTEDAPAGGDPNPDCEGSAWAKRIGEKAAGYYRQESGMRIIIARLANVFGPRDDFSSETAHLVGNVMRTIAEGKVPELHGDGTQLRAFLFVTDAVEALLRLVEVGAFGGTVNVCAQSEVSVSEAIETIMAAMGIQGLPITKSGPTGVSRRLLDSTKLRSLTGFRERVSFREGIERTVSWFLENRTSCRGSGMTLGH